MKGNSLRLRLVAGGAVAIFVALAISGFVLTVLFERQIVRAVADELEVHLKQLLAGIDVDADGHIVLSEQPTDPRFSEPLSGLYWQIGDDKNRLLRSRSLWDETIAPPPDNPEQSELHLHQVPGPAGSNILLAERRVRMTVAGKPNSVRLIVAADVKRIAAAKTAFAADLTVALLALGAILAAATWIHVGLGLRPLDAVRRAVAEVRASQDRRLTAQMPDEVQPLVDELNALLDARAQDIERSRNRASDLAHGLKTPLAALAADSDRLRKKGEIAIANDIQAVIDAMRRHVDRELARARLRADAGMQPGIATPLAPLVKSLVDTLSRTSDGARIAYETRVPDDIVAPFDRTDLAEVMGNLLENATRHARSRVRTVAHRASEGMTISVEDDGKGIDPASRSIVLARGVRQDERGGGAGLGFAIVQDVLEAYGWTLQLDQSELGGLKASCCETRKTSSAEPARAAAG